MHGNRNRPRIRVESHGENLAQAGELALHEPGSAGPDVALDALDFGVRRVLIRGVLGLHHGVAGLAAEGDRIHVVDGAVAELAGDGDVSAGGDEDEVDQLAQLRVAPLGTGEIRRIDAGVPFPFPLDPHAERDEEQAGEERARQQQKGQNTHVRVCLLAAQRGGQQEKPEHGGGGDQNHAGQADPVTRQMNERGQPAAEPAVRLVRRHGG